MARCFAVIDRGNRVDLHATLQAACAAMTRGGSHENRFEIVRPPFAAAVLSHGNGPPFQDVAGDLHLDLGQWIGEGAGPGEGGLEPGAAFQGFTLAPDAAVASGREPAAGPAGRRSRIVWSSARGELRVDSEPNGQAPLYAFVSGDRVLIASETKAIQAVHPGTLDLDADGLLELFLLGHLIVDRTLFREVRWIPPGESVRFGPHGVQSDPATPLRFSEGRAGGVGPVAEQLNRSLIDVLSAYRHAAPRMTVALTGGMDSRYLMAAARRVWQDLDALTFGEPGSTDVELGRELARIGGLPHRHLAPSSSFLSEWAGYAVWRSDGMLSCLHAHGMDAVIAAAGESRHVLNGMGGDLLMGAFLRAGDLSRNGDPAAAARSVMRRSGSTGQPLESIFKPELLERAATRPEATLAEALARYPHARLGNVLLGYWLRHRCARLTILGLGLESPFVEYWTPFVDPSFVRAAAELTLEARFMSRAHRRALGRLAPELTAVRWERAGIAPRHPWPLIAAARLLRRLGLARRSRPAVDYSTGFRTMLRSWMEGILLEPRTLERGHFRPEYLRALIADHLHGADRAAEIGMALTIELWRRIFVERDESLAPRPGD